VTGSGALRRHDRAVRGTPAVASALAWLLVVSPVGARGLSSHVQPLDTQSDGDYGRMANDWTLSATGLVELSPVGPAPAARLAAHYFWMAGVYTGVTVPSGFPADAGVLGLGVDLRPAFVPRWSMDLEQGPSYLDLWLDSLSLGLGVYWQSERDEGLALARGFECSLGFGFPLLGEALGPWLDARGLLRLPDSTEPGQWGAQLGLGWHWGLNTSSSD
jgi:hypothetical protein